MNPKNNTLRFNIILIFIILLHFPILFSQSFSIKTDFITGNLPIWVSLSDLNGDNKPDLVVVNHDDNSVSVYLNTTELKASKPSFSPKVDFVTGFTPYVVLISDLNADAKSDLVVTNISSPSSFSVLINETETNSFSPSFSPKIDFITEPGPFSAAISDLNNDGKPDIVTTNSVIPYSVSVFLNNTVANDSIPSFLPRQNFATGSKPQSVVISDLNGDDKTDLVVANREDNTVSVFFNITLNNSLTAVFAPRKNFTTAEQPYSIAISDFNGDGKPDLVVADSASAAVSIFFNTTVANTFIPMFTEKKDFTTGGLPVAVAISDFNRDESQDLVVANYQDNSVSVLINATETNATLPEFLSKKDFSTGRRPMSVAVADINGDTKPDLAVANFTDNTVSILLNKSEVTSVDENIDSYPKLFSLSQNYPNPFNPTTTINFSIPFVETGYIPSVQLKIYDVLGREVATLINEEKPAGNYQVKFDASNLLADRQGLSSGIYFYQLKTDSKIITRKMVLMK